MQDKEEEALATVQPWQKQEATASLQMMKNDGGGSVDAAMTAVLLAHDEISSWNKRTKSSTNDFSLLPVTVGRNVV